MNRKKLACRSALAEKIVHRWSVRRWFQKAYLGVISGFYTNVPNRFTYLGVDGIYQSDYDFPGGKLISENIKFKP